MIQTVWQTFSVTGQMVRISGFVTHSVSVEITRLCCYAQYVNKWV